jgi:hypothetical protein
MLFGAIFLLAIPLVATTFAAQVTISGTQGGAIEFGQGNQAAVACDTSIQTSVGEIWSSAQTNFIVDTVTLMNLDVNSGSLSSTISNQGCGLKTLKVALYDTSSVQTAIGADSSTLVSFGVPTTDGSITPLTGNLGGSTNISATLINSTETITAVSAVNSDTSVTYTYSATSYASTYPMAVGDYVTITGTTGCNYSGAYVSAVTAVSGGSGTFTVNQSSTSGCATASGLNAKVYGKGVIQFTLPATTLNFVATRVGRVSLESQ